MSDRKQLKGQGFSLRSPCLMVEKVDQKEQEELAVLCLSTVRRRRV